MNIQGHIKEWLINFGFPKILIGILVLFLLYQEFISYLVKKPTQNSLTEMELTPNLNPHIYVCNNPPYEVKKFKYIDLVARVVNLLSFILVNMGIETLTGILWAKI